jgi:hypothetical protein
MSDSEWDNLKEELKKVSKNMKDVKFLLNSTYGKFGNSMDYEKIKREHIIKERNRKIGEIIDNPTDEGE